MIQRKIQQQLLKPAAMYPVVTITGPRQSGKTTLAKMTFPNHQYVKSAWQPGCGESTHPNRSPVIRCSADSLKTWW
jgi:hypothetical protein